MTEVEELRDLGIREGFLDQVSFFGVQDLQVKNTSYFEIIFGCCSIFF